MRAMGRLRGWTAPAAVALVLCVLGFAGGCETYGVAAPGGADTVTVTLPRPAAPKDVTARLFLYRSTARRTGERIGVGRSFEIGSGRQVRAVLEMEGLQPEEELQLHVLWVNPDGKKAFVKEVWVRPEDWSRAPTDSVVAAQRLQLDRQRGGLELESRYGIDPVRLEEEMHKPEEARLFRPGRWTVRIYLFRVRILETSFDIVTAP
jgi:hypothetical protein